MTSSNDAQPLFADLSLARRLERAEARAGASFVEARAKVSPQCGAQWIEVAGAYAMFDIVSSPVTQTFGLGLFQEVTDVELERIERFFFDRGAPVFHEVSPLSGVAVQALLHKREYEPVEFTSVMYRSIHGGLSLSSRWNERIQVRQARDKDQELWAQVAARGWCEVPELTEGILEVAKISSQSVGTVSFLAEMDGQPIATAALCIGEGVALLAGASTVPEGRKQGAQLALLENRLRYAAGQGCDIAMMCAQPGSSSQRNAERHGFRIAYTRLKWRLSPQAPA